MSLSKLRLGILLVFPQNSPCNRSNQQFKDLLVLGAFPGSNRWPLTRILSHYSDHCAIDKQYKSCISSWINWKRSYYLLVTIMIIKNVDDLDLGHPKLTPIHIQFKIWRTVKKGRRIKVNNEWINGGVSRCLRDLYYCILKLDWFYTV